MGICLLGYLLRNYIKRFVEVALIPVRFIQLFDNVSC